MPDENAHGPIFPLPDTITRSPAALRQWVATHTTFDLLRYIEAGYVSTAAIRGGKGELEVDPPRAAILEQMIVERARDRADTEALYRLAASDAGVAYVLAGLDDVEAALELLEVEPMYEGGPRLVQFHPPGVVPNAVLLTDELYVLGRSSEAVAEALVVTRREPSSP